ncbi:Sphingosine kinase 1 [Apostichopus japonicus]|uniref:Sphingosine kinase 1 n=1 Tax=Stichopus japonicus TaxID=307972 RepID=A0A2G8L3T5_STIJA|nr:Sphingosine kinase 1 [Apostichopus japonicus]
MIGHDATDYPLSSRRRKRKFLVCINPFSGPGNAKQIYSHEVKPVFQEADIEVEELVTIKQNHAREFARTVSYKDYDAVIIVSGDGLIFEWLNGIMERDDRDQAIKLPMGIIPAGSGNALATAMLVSKQEQCFKNSHLHSALLAAKGRPTPMDVVEVHYGKKKVYSFLAVAWGIISDIDIESEWLRFMGSPRFTIQAFIRIMALRKYRGILYYLPAEGYSQSSHSTQNGHVVGGGGNEGESSNHKAPLVNNTSVSVQAGDGILNPSFQSSESQESHDGSSESDSPTTQQPLLPPLSEPVPSNWVKVEGKFVCIVVLQDSHLSRDIVAWPNRAFNEGVMCIQYVMYPVSRRHLLDVMVEMGKGDHMEKNSVTSVFVKAFRIEPLEEDGIVTVDGEKVEFGPIQGQMMETKANILIPS